MGSQELILFGALGAVLLIVVIILVRVLLLIGHLNTSFAKLGFVVREDAKKYFDDAATKIVDTDEAFRQKYQKIVEDGTRVALSDTGAAMQKGISKAQDYANTIILNARTDAQQILQAAHKDAEERTEKTLERTGDAIGWVMTQYLGRSYSTSDHEALIEEQIKKYVDEHRK